MLPSRFRLAVVPVVALLAAACQDRGSPVAPEVAAPRASVVATTCDAAADARAHELLNLVFAPGERDSWHLVFNRGRQAAEQGRLADAWTIYAPLLAEIAARAAAAPAGSTLPGVVNELASLILVCSGQPGVDPALLALLNLPEAERIERDVAFTVVSPTTNLQLVTPKRHFGVSAPAAFFDETALLVISRIADAPPFLGTHFTEYPPRFNVTLIPYTAQANFDDVAPLGYGPEDVLDEGVFAEIAICPGPGHPDADVRVLRRPEPFLAEPTALLPLSVPAVATLLACAEAGSTPYPSLALSPSERAFAGVASVAMRVAGLLQPRAAHAVDGGIGGRTSLFSDYVGASPILPPGSHASVVDRVIFTLGTPDGPVVVTHLPLAPNPTEILTAVAQNADGSPVTGTVTCTWSSNKPTDVVVVVNGTSSTTATLTRSPGYTGAAKVTAVCNGTAGSLQILPGVAHGG